MTSYLEKYIRSPAFDAGALKKAVLREKAERNLDAFILQAWDVIEPGTTYVDNWHIGLIAEHLQAVNDGELRRLIINIPPRYMKTIEVTVCYPAWTWTRHPEKRFIKVSYSDGLSRKSNILSRDIITSPWYQQNWGDRFALKYDVNRQNEFENNHHGMMYSTSVGGAVTGNGADVIIIDDPQNPLMANSETERQNSIDFFRNTLQTRLNDPKTGAFIIIMQRLHENDLTGYILSEDLGYTHLCLPAEAPSRTVITFPKSGRKIIREEGDILNPQRFDTEVLSGLKKSMGSLQYAGQFQQRPAPAEGAIFKRSWFKFYKELPSKITDMLQSWDCTFKDVKSSDYVVGQVWGKVGADRYLIDQTRGIMSFTETIQAIRTLSAKHPKATRRLIEDKANGSAIIDFLSHEISGLIPVNPEGGKVVRAQATSPQFEAGNIYLPDPSIAPWIHDYVEEFLLFPFGTNDDQVDSTTQANTWYNDNKTFDLKGLIS